ncbi:hypothetical protein NM208_g2868 [Fusarium decemcellulare]|uniref:Uncharacterized protein n=1 Tax=Fusarium decemcellulare TaxID=57161 RepID=A0ACC1SQZ7_9HYPO|nr:hypothetical protein NM208_g2868 [Fusarium decemcellulare]
MSQPILSIKSDDKTVKVVANLLPCRIHHDGPIDPVSTYWAPTSADDGTKLAYFRGRKLQGRTVKLPEQCRGVVVEREQDKDPQPTVEEPAEDGDTETERIGTMRVTAEFDEMVVWGHETVADASGDPYVRSIEEWIQVADSIHSYSAADEAVQK